MSSREPERAEYERRVVAWLRRRSREEGHPVYYRHGRISFEEVRLEDAGSVRSSVVVTFRAPGRPDCLFSRREDAVGPQEPWEDPSGAPEQWAQMIWILLEEDILTRPGLPKKCETGTVTWM